MLARIAWTLGVAFFLGCSGNGTPPGGGGDDDDGVDGGLPGEVPCVATGAEVAGDGVDNDCDGLVDEQLVCATGGAEYTTIAAALAAVPAGTDIQVCAGTYAERLEITGKSVNLGGAGADTTILDAGGAGVAVKITGGAAVGIEGFTIRNGVVPGAGGGIACANSALTLRHSALIDNRAAGGGGGLAATDCAVHVDAVHVEGNEGHPVGGGLLFIASTGDVSRSQFIGNSAEEGGAIRIDNGTVAIVESTFETNQARARGGALYLNGDATVEDSTFSANHSGWTGGAIYVWQHAPTLRRNRITQSTAAHEGGGIYLHQSSATISDNQIDHNHAEDDGGGLRMFESRVHLEHNVITDNVAASDGGGLKKPHLPGLYVDNVIQNNTAGAAGGIELDNDSSVVRGGIISGNRAAQGGAIHIGVWPWNGGTIENVQILDNHAWRGAGLDLEHNYFRVTLRGLTIKGNTGGVGAGIYAQGSPFTLTNSIITGNTASNRGGGIYLGVTEPFTEPCPCPPVNPPFAISFVVVDHNVAPTGAAVWTDAPNASISSSIFVGHVRTAVTVEGGATPTWRYNDTYPATFSGMSYSTGTNGNLAHDPMFADPSFHLRGDSVCHDAGEPTVTDRDGSRADMGAYAGPDPM